MNTTSRVDSAVLKVAFFNFLLQNHFLMVLRGGWWGCYGEKQDDLGGDRESWAGAAIKQDGRTLFSIILLP